MLKANAELTYSMTPVYSNIYFLVNVHTTKDDTGKYILHVDVFLKLYSLPFPSQYQHEQRVLILYMNCGNCSISAFKLYPCITISFYL